MQGRALRLRETKTRLVQARAVRMSCEYLMRRVLRASTAGARSKTTLEKAYDTIDLLWCFI